MTISQNKQQTSFAIEINDVCKKYLLNQTPFDRFRELIGLGRPSHVAEHLALNGVSLNILKGETIGILGVNGAGKSTLLQVITGILKPSFGTVKAHGRIAALLELGAGFNPMWSGRKNAEFQCVLQGVKANEIKGFLSKVEEFADIGAYFDEPVRTYSSGMYLRVAFAAAVVNMPDILIVDEALAVGDVKFQNKCFRRFEEMQEQGCTILFVTHSPDLVSQLCTRAIIINEGKLLADGTPSDISKLFMRLTTGATDDESKKEKSKNTRETEKKEFAADIIENRHNYNAQELRSGAGGAKIVDALLHRGDFIEILDPISLGEKLHLSVRLKVKKDIELPEVGLIIRSATNQILSGASNWMIDRTVNKISANSELNLQWSFTPSFLAGSYFIDLGIADTTDEERLVQDLRQSVVRFDISSAKPIFGIVDVNFTLDHKV